MRFPKWPRWVWRCYAATFAAVVAFGACSFYPMWDVRQAVNDGYGRLHFVEDYSLWGMLGHEGPGDYSDETCKRVVTWEWETPAIITAVAVHIAAILGALFGGRLWRNVAQTSPPGSFHELERGSSSW